jgi:hypothetical protein
MKAYRITLQRTVVQQLEVEVHAPDKDAAIDMAASTACELDPWDHVVTEDYGVVYVDALEEDPEEEEYDFLEDFNNPASRHHY